MLNKRGLGKRVVVTALASRAPGAVVVEQEWVGVVTTAPAAGAKYALDCEGEFEVPFIASSVKGDTVWIGTTTFAMARTAAQAAAPTITGNASVVPLGKVSAVPGDGPDTSDMGYGPVEPLTGLMWIVLFDQRP